MTLRRRSVFADRLLEFADFVFSDGKEFQRRGTWRDFFMQRIGPAFNGRVVLEIGCNDASLLERVAAKHPTTAFIGVDWKYRALHTAAQRVAAAGLRNVALLHGRGQDVRRIFADDDIDDVWVFHPDPCDRPKEVPNRLIAPRWLVDLHPVLREGGALILKTDHAGYHAWVLGLVNSPEVVERFELAIASSDFWNDRVAQSHSERREFAGEATVFEERFRRKHRPIYYLEMTRQSAAANP